MEPCFPVIDPSGRYWVTVQEIYNEQGRFTFDPLKAHSRGAVGPCDKPLGIVPGAVLQFQMTGTIENGSRTCSLTTADLSAAPQEIAIQGRSTNMFAVSQARGESLFYAVEDVEIGSCAGALALTAYPGGAVADILSVPIAGQLPPVILYRYFLPVDPSCQTQCNDNFVVALSKE